MVYGRFSYLLAVGPTAIFRFLDWVSALWLVGSGLVFFSGFGFAICQRYLCGAEWCHFRFYTIEMVVTLSYTIILGVHMYWSSDFPRFIMIVIIVIIRSIAG